MLKRKTKYVSKNDVKKKINAFSKFKFDADKLRFKTNKFQKR